MFLATYTYCRPDANASGGRICKTITRPMMTESAQYSKELIIKEHEKKNETISGEIELIGSLP